MQTVFFTMVREEKAPAATRFKVVLSGYRGERRQVFNYMGEHWEGSTPESAVNAFFSDGRPGINRLRNDPVTVEIHWDVSNGPAIPRPPAESEPAPETPTRTKREAAKAEPAATPPVVDSTKDNPPAASTGRKGGKGRFGAG